MSLYDNPEFLKGYRELRRTGQGINDALEIPAMDAVLGRLPVEGARVVDLGCGEGGLAVRLASEGAEVLAVDASEQMLAAALRHPRVRYRQADIATLDLPDGSADIVVSSMALHYVEDFDGLVGRVVRWISSGTFVFSMEHPVMTAPVVVADCVVDDYADEGRRERSWFVDGVVKYHRTIGSIAGSLRRHGFRLDVLAEPLPTADQVRALPHLAIHRRRPPILVVSASTGFRAVG